MTFILARHVLESTVFAIALGFAMLFFRVRGAGARHALWFVAAAKFAVPAEFFWKLGASLQSLFSPVKLSVPIPHELTSLLMLQMAHSTETRALSGSVSPLILIWLAGAVVTLAMWLRKLFARVSSLEECREFDDLLPRLRKSIGLRTEVAFRLSDSNVEPVLSGFWRPAVVIPKRLLLRFSPPELETVVLHELAHAKRWDNWTGAFAHTVTCVFWFHPLLWWIERRLHWERELACDEMVIRHGARPRDYVASILKVCRFHLTENVAGVSSVSSSSLTNRLEVIMSLSASAAVPRFPRFSVGALVGIMTIVPMVFGLIATPSAYSQADGERNQGKKAKPLSCVFASVEYPEGTVIQEQGGPEQMCARVLSPRGVGQNSAPEYVAQWIHTSNEIRERGKTVVRIPQPPQPPAFVCTPKPSAEAKSCSCEEGAPFSQGATVDSASGKLRCDQGRWVSTTNAGVAQR